jgi:hypothetical protein
VLGQALGPAKGAGNEMAQWTLKANCKVVPCRSSRPLKVDEIHSPADLKKREMFDKLIEKKCGKSVNPLKPNSSENDGDNEFKEHEVNDEPKRIAPDIEVTVDAVGKRFKQQPACNNILRSEVSLELGESMTVGKVSKPALGPNGTVAGAFDGKPLSQCNDLQGRIPQRAIKRARCKCHC